ncbi:AfsR/SARP family transcriptional regulator [Allokutzneria albata]|uniref:DNA-binding transcriptional activator of the SARP family n=1 Tax=Allokutzneria albata TaxID=211114 RepID=A0A1G9U0C2_ALLAB|nr:BTAD domain-containing putative transcriptional regulator [Allokutzneria albata]SDM53328.1 DNA-binding transcriptional activator of the SARP family [Allokutzneria albata]
MLRLLGEVAVDADGRPVDLGPAKQQCVLAALAVEAGRLVPADRLAVRVWGEDVPRRARATLYSYISRLRQALADVDGVVIERRSGGYALLADSVDLHRFHALRAAAREQADDERAVRLLTEALELWRGDALTGLDSEWAEAERARLARERLAAQGDLVDAQLRSGQGERLVAELAARVGEHPLDERVAGQYMRALNQAGRTADALEHYRRLRARLVDELGTDPGAALQELHRKLLGADPALTVAPGGRLVPRQLPAAPVPFVGRTDELDRLGGTVVIAGAGGVGKTWLALHWAHRHIDRFPDGQLFVDLRGFSPENSPMDPAVAVRGFLGALGVDPGQVPADPHARSALFRSLVADRRMVLVLDNAVDTAQVAPLLPGSEQCTVIVTSRYRLTGLVTGHGAQHVPLDVLAETEARDLLRDRLGAARVVAEPAAVDLLIALCGGFPLALTIVAAHAQTRPRLPLAELADELHDLGLSALDDDDPSASLPSVLSWSYRALTPEEANAFALLGIAPGPDIGVHAAAALVGLPLNTTRTLLRGLEQASLTSRDARGRYVMHDLVRRYAADLAQELPDAALRRVADFYLHTAYACDRLLAPHREPVPLDPPAPGVHLQNPDHRAAAMVWFETEHQCLLAVQQLTFERGWQHSTWRIAWVLNTYLQVRVLPRDWLGVWQLARKATEDMADPGMDVVALQYIGLANANLGHTREGIQHLERALDLAERHGDQVNRGHLHRALARAWEQQGDDHRALEHSAQALSVYQRSGNPVWEAIGLNSVGWDLAKLGHYDEARQRCRAALVLHRHLDTPAERANTLDSLGYIEHHAGNHEEAITYYREALALYRDLGNRLGVVDPLVGLGNAHAALGRPEQAQAVWEEALELYVQLGRDEDALRVRQRLLSLSGTNSLHPGMKSDSATPAHP